MCGAYSAIPTDGNQKTIFAEKVAMTKEQQFDGVRNAYVWRSILRNYFVSEAEQMDPLLQLLEQNADMPAS